MFNYVLPDGGEPFAFFENTGVLVVNGSLNREKQDRYSFLVKERHLPRFHTVLADSSC